MKYNCPALSQLNYCDTVELLSVYEEKSIFRFSNAFGKKYDLKIINKDYVKNDDSIYFSFTLKGEKINFKAFEIKSKPNYSIYGTKFTKFEKAFSEIFKKI